MRLGHLAPGPALFPSTHHFSLPAASTPVLCRKTRDRPALEPKHCPSSEASKSGKGSIPWASIWGAESIRCLTWSHQQHWNSPHFCLYKMRNCLLERWTALTVPGPVTNRRPTWDLCCHATCLLDDYLLKSLGSQRLKEIFKELIELCLCHTHSSVCWFFFFSFSFFLERKTDHLVKNIFLRDHLRHSTIRIAKYRGRERRRGAKEEKQTFSQSLKPCEMLQTRLPRHRPAVHTDFQAGRPLGGWAGWPRPPPANLRNPLKFCPLKTNQLPPPQSLGVFEFLLLLPKPDFLFLRKKNLLKYPF